MFLNEERLLTRRCFVWKIWHWMDAIILLKFFGPLGWKSKEVKKTGGYQPQLYMHSWHSYVDREKNEENDRLRIRWRAYIQVQGYYIVYLPEVTPIDWFILPSSCGIITWPERSSQTFGQTLIGDLQADLWYQCGKISMTRGSKVCCLIPVLIGFQISISLVEPRRPVNPLTEMGTRKAILVRIEKSQLAADLDKLRISYCIFLSNHKFRRCCA
jgi:hypothetical protein